MQRPPEVWPPPPGQSPSPHRLKSGGEVVPFLRPESLQQLARPLRQEDVLLTEGPVTGHGAAALLPPLQLRPEVVEDLLALLHHGLLLPGDCLDGGQQSVATVEVLEPHPVREPPRHQVDGLQHLQRPNLLDDEAPAELIAGLRLVGSDTADEVRLRLDQGPQQVVQPGVEVLGQGRHRLVSIEKV